MITTLNLELKDVPGQLVEALEPFSKYGTNIISVAHHREKKTPKGTVPVEISVETDSEDEDKERLDEVIAELEERGVEIVSVGKERLEESFSIIMIGHIVHKGIREMIDLIDDTGFAEVIDLDLSMPGINERSSARFFIKAAGKKYASKTVELMEEAAEEKDLKIIKEMNI